MSGDAGAAAAGAAPPLTLPPFPSSDVELGSVEDMYMGSSTPMDLSYWNDAMPIQGSSGDKRSADVAGLDTMRMAEEMLAMRSILASTAPVPKITCAGCSRVVYAARHCCGDAYCGLCESTCGQCGNTPILDDLPPTMISVICPNHITGCSARAVVPLAMTALINPDVTFFDVRHQAARDASSVLKDEHSVCKYHMVSVCPEHVHIRKCNVIPALATCPACYGGVTQLYFSKVKELMDGILATNPSDAIKQAIQDLSPT